MLENQEKNIATFIHLSTFSRFVIPLGNYIGPALLWMLYKDKSDFVDAHGKQAINFQISILLYTIIIGMLALPVIFFTVLGHVNVFDMPSLDTIQFRWAPSFYLLILIGGIVTLFIMAFLFELICVIIASLKARDGLLYKYPITINFLK